MKKDRIASLIERVYCDGYDTAKKELDCDPFDSSIVFEVIREIYDEKQDKREELAERDHDYWRGEMRDIYRKLDKRDDGAIVIPSHLVSYFLLIMTRRYDELPHPEKEFSRNNADKIINGLQVNVFDVSACHFCGSDMIRLMKITYPEGTHEKTDSPTGYQVSCINCSARGPGGNETSEAAFIAWNKEQKM